ncbi:hypothetical protein [Aliarcobacter butzleri]|uniref:hypothetical protein n=1 Tax=Aliarcobacter butzleri TaxID=28197 RepID=UPI00126A4937|nr:hypothetical protein [Aliarcobacter butzleri]
MKTLNMKEIAKTIVDYLTNSVEIATEKSKNYQNYRQDTIGNKFEKFPFSTCQYKHGTWKQNLQFIGVNGEVIDTCNCLELFKNTNGQEVNKIRREWRLKGKEDDIVVAIISTIVADSYRPDYCENNSVVLFLSKPYTVKEINNIRASFYTPLEKERIENALDKIKIIWE